MTGVTDILYVRFSVPDLDRQKIFLEDFGMLVDHEADILYARGTDPGAAIYVAEQGEPRFLGMGFELENARALQAIAAIDGVQVNANSAFWGGHIARLTDPDGYSVEVVCGIEKSAALAVPSRSAFNTGSQRLRLGERASFDRQAHTVKRLGHCVLAVTDFRVSEAWYKKRFGLLTSDEVYVGDESNVLGAFMRVDRGDAYVDHHTLFLVAGPAAAFNHAAFEIADWDCLMEGHHNLLEAGHTHSWGVGKHLLGSQVFDYWKDPHGFTLEHFTDGDLVNADFGSHKAPVDQLLGTHWGPEGAPA